MLARAQTSHYTLRCEYDGATTCAHNLYMLVVVVTILSYACICVRKIPDTHKQYTLKQ